MDEYRKKLCEAVKKFDKDEFRSVVKQYDPHGYSNHLKLMEQDRYTEGLMAKMAFAYLDVPEETLKKAQKALDELGWRRSIWQEK